jgi:hypothetical protein
MRAAGPAACRPPYAQGHGDLVMNQIVYIIGAVVIVLAVLSFFGLR